MNGSKVDLSNEGLAEAIKKRQFSDEELDSLRELEALTEEEFAEAKAVPKAPAGPDRWAECQEAWLKTAASEEKATITFSGETIELSAAEFDVMTSAIPCYTEDAWEMEDDFPGIEKAAEALHKKRRVFNG